MHTETQNNNDTTTLGSQININRPDVEKGEDLTLLPEYDGYLDLGFNQPIRTSAKPLESSPDFIKGK